MSGRETCASKHLSPKRAVAGGQHAQLLEDLTSELDVAQAARGDELTIANGRGVHVIRSLGVLATCERR